MKLKETNLNCNIPSLILMSEGDAPSVPSSFLRKVKLFIRRRMSPQRERIFKRITNDMMNWIAKKRGRETRPADPVANITREHLKAGDLVRVRTYEEIQATLNNWRQLKGLTFMPEMEVFCGTHQVVLKHMRRFVDERDLQVKKSTGIILLQGVICQGTADFGSCDRSCFHFWREEWLEKIDSVETETQITS